MLSRRLVLACLAGFALSNAVAQARGTGIEQIDLRVEGMT